jgi:hypothetical protein
MPRPFVRNGARFSTARSRLLSCWRPCICVLMAIAAGVSPLRADGTGVFGQTKQSEAAMMGIPDEAARRA